MSEQQYTIETGSKIRLWGGWYRHDTVRLSDGTEIGRIQVRRRNKRQDVITLDTQQAGVLGSDVQWLLRRYKETL